MGMFAVIITKKLKWGYMISMKAHKWNCDSDLKQPHKPNRLQFFPSDPKSTQWGETQIYAVRRIFFYQF
jgi:hypothetical protein